MSTQPASVPVGRPPAEETDLASILRRIPPRIIEAQNAYCRDRPWLLRERKGQWVVYHGSNPVAFAKTYAEVFRECQRRQLPEDEHVIYRVEEECDLEPIDPDTIA